MNLSPSLLVSQPVSNPDDPAHRAQQRGNTSRPAEATAARRQRNALLRWWLVSGLALAAWAGSAALHSAHAAGVVWSVGVQVPGGVVQVANLPPPRVVLPAPVVLAPVVVAPAPHPHWQPYGPPGHHRHGHHRHGHRWQGDHGRAMGWVAVPEPRGPWQAQSQGWAFREGHGAFQHR